MFHHSCAGNRGVQAPPGAAQHIHSRSGIRACGFLFTKIKITQQRALFLNESKWHHTSMHYSRRNCCVNIWAVVYQQRMPEPGRMNFTCLAWNVKGETNMPSVSKIILCSKWRDFVNIANTEASDIFLIEFAFFFSCLRHK